MDVLSGAVSAMRVGRAKFTRSRRAPGWGNRFGPYPGAGFHIVLRGSCWLSAPDGHTFALHSGDVVFLPHGAVHGLSDRPGASIETLPPDPGGSAGPRDGPEPGGADAASGTGPSGTDRSDTDRSSTDLLCGAYRLDHGLAHPLMHALPDVIHVQAGSHHDLQAVVDVLTGELVRPRPGADAVLPGLLDVVLIHLLRAWLVDQALDTPSRGWPAALTDPALLAALDRMHERPAHPWTVSELAGVAAMSRTAFARRFARTLGQPPLAYLTWWRLNCAARELVDTDAALASIARQVGYGSEYTFAHAFRREFGLAPGRFRHQRRHHDAAPMLTDAPTDGRSERW